MRSIVSIVLALCVLALGGPRPDPRGFADSRPAKIEQARHVAIALATRPGRGPDADVRPDTLVAAAVALPPPPADAIAAASQPPRAPFLRTLSSRSSRGPPRG